MLPWWRVGDTVINPQQVMAVQFLRVPGDDLLARVYLPGRRFTAVGAEARLIKRHWDALTGARGQQQLGYYWPEDVRDNESPDVRDAA